MVSTYWPETSKVTDAIENARNNGVKFYASYSYNEGDYGHPGDTKTTRDFVKNTLAKYLDTPEPWQLPAIEGHGQTVWDVATFDGDGDGRADIWEVILGDTNLNENEGETNTTITEE